MTAASPSGLRVLLLTKTEYDDPRDGGTLRVSAIVERLRAEGAVVDAVPVRAPDGRSAPARHLGSLPQAPVAVARALAATLAVASASVARWFSPRVARSIAGLRARHDYDVALIEYSQLFIYAPLLAGLPIVCDLHNVEHELLDNYARTASSRLRRVVATYEAARVRRLERRLLRKATAITTVSDHDTQLLTALQPGAAARIQTAPNGVADRAFLVAREPAAELEVVFIGMLGWQPNVDAASWLVREVWPRVRELAPDARLRLVGRSPRASVVAFGGHDGVSVHADVPDTMPYLARARVATAPLLAAGGTRLKILEALAAGTPVVATSLGALGLEATASDGALTIADSAEDFARAVVAVASDPPQTDVVRAAAEPYRWGHTLTPLVETVRYVAGLRRSRFDDAVG